MRGLCTENYKTLIKTLKTQMNGRRVLFQELEKLILFKKITLPKDVYRLSVVPSKSQWYFS